MKPDVITLSQKRILENITIYYFNTNFSRSLVNF